MSRKGLRPSKVQAAPFAGAQKHNRGIMTCVLMNVKFCNLECGATPVYWAIEMIPFTS